MSDMLAIPMQVCKFFTATPTTAVGIPPLATEILNASVVPPLFTSNCIGIFFFFIEECSFGNIMCYDYACVH